MFSYRTTGYGKTYTMLGARENPGVMVFAIKDLFLKVKQRSHHLRGVLMLCHNCVGCSLQLRRLRRSSCAVLCRIASIYS